MGQSKSYKDLLVWQRAMELVEAVYKESRKLPKEETYGLTIQIRRAAISIAANIAEGQGRNTRGEFKQFLGIANGSLAELETLIILANRLSYWGSQQMNMLLAFCSDVGKMIAGLLKHLEGKQIGSQAGN